MPIRGSLDVLRDGLVAGWVMRPDRPSQPLRIRLRANNALIAEMVAETYRPDLAAAGVGNGCYGFAVTGASARLPPEGCQVTVEDQASGHVVLVGCAAPATANGAAPQPATLPGIAMQGYLDSVTFERISGWAWYPTRPFDAVTIRVRADGRVIGRAIANIHRTDVEQAGFGTGRYGFQLSSEFNPPVGPCLIAAEDDDTGAALTHSPARLEPPLDLNGPASAAIAALFESPGTAEELRARAAFAGHHADRLIQRLADLRSRSTARASQRARKWRWGTEDGPEPPRIAPRALVIDHTIPCPNRDAGSNAILSHMASLRRLGFDILFVPADMRDGPGVRALDELGIDCATDPWCGSVEEVMRREAGAFDLVYIHRHGAADRYAAMARQYMPHTRRIYSVADLHGLRLARQGQVEDRADLVAHASVVHQLEINAAANCHAVVTHSHVEAAILRKALPQGRVEVVPWHVPVQPTQPSFAERTGLAFVGSYSHAPNLDAALWLRDEVLPLVWASEPGIVCTLAGTDMPPTLAEGHDPRIQAVGRVDRLSDLLGQVRLTVAPMAYGAGLKGKVADSLAMGVPCICSPIAAEGFDLPTPLRELVAADAAGLAAAIIRLHRDPALFAACREAGLAYVSEAFSEAVVDAGLRRAAGLPAMLASG